MSELKEICTAIDHIFIFLRYYKQTWTASRCCNLDQWFIMHRMFMMLTWGLTIAGFVLILLELDGLSKTFDTNPHALLGFITVGLCFLQPFLALIRCSPNHRYRGWFNWVHWFIGRRFQFSKQELYDKSFRKFCADSWYCLHLLCSWPFQGSVTKAWDRLAAGWVCGIPFHHPLTHVLCYVCLRVTVKQEVI